jgi:phage terminase large subunit-like protein
MPAKGSLLGSLLSLPPAQRTALLSSLSEKEAEALLYDWPLWARPNQLPPPGDWTKWLLLAGRGFGKSRAGAEWVIAKAREHPGCRIAMVARTAADTRDVMVEGESGVLAISAPDFKPEYQPSKRRVIWPNGSQATLFSAEEPDALRGPQSHFAWCDEVASWKYPETWDMMLFGLRLGTHPQVVITTTPRPVKLVKELTTDPSCITVRGSTYENRANLAPAFFSQIVTKYEGTRLGRQELNAEVLDDNPGALWTRALIEASRVTTAPHFTRIVVGVDPEATSTEDSAETGIIVAGLGVDGHGYIIDDRSVLGTPHEWGTAAVTAYHRNNADRIVGEVNNGGEMVGYVIYSIDDSVAYKAVHASRSKQARAEPVSALYEQGRVHHLGTFPELEDQMSEWVPGTGARSPDRLDALVWALTELMLEQDDYQTLVYDDEPELISQY